MSEDQSELMTKMQWLETRLQTLEQMTSDRQDQVIAASAPLVFPMGDARMGEGGGHPGPFEPVFDAEGKLSSYTDGLYAYGRRFYKTTAIDDTAKVAEGFIGLEITHATYSNDNPSATVVLIENGMVPLANTATDRTVLPLYKIKGGQIEVDYRCYLASLAVRE